MMIQMRAMLMAIIPKKKSSLVPLASFRQPSTSKVDALKTKSSNA